MKRLFGLSYLGSTSFIKNDDGTMFFERKDVAKKVRNDLAKKGKPLRVVVGPDHIHYTGYVK